MASGKSFVEYVTGQMGLAGEVTARKMFGEYGLYLDGKFFACVCDDQLFLKITPQGEALAPDCPKAPPYQGASLYFLVEDLEDREVLCKLARVTCDSLPAPKPKKKR